MDKNGTNLASKQEIPQELPQDQQINISQDKYLNNRLRRIISQLKAL